VVLNCLTTYSNWSSKHINIAKSAMFYSKNCRTASRNSINGILNLIQVLLGLSILVFLFSCTKRSLNPLPVSKTWLEDDFKSTTSLGGCS
jgi:hypothetical protein